MHALTAGSLCSLELGKGLADTLVALARRNNEDTGTKGQPSRTLRVTEPSVAVLLAFEILQTLVSLDLELLKSVQGEERTDEVFFFFNPIEFKV